MRIGEHDDDVPVLLVHHGARDILMRRRTVYDVRFWRFLFMYDLS